MQANIVLAVEFDHHAQTVSRIVKILREERQNRGFSQETLARKAGLSRTGIRHVESGDFKPTLYTLLKIAEALNVSLPRLLIKAQKLEDESGKSAT